MLNFNNGSNDSMTIDPSEIVAVKVGSEKKFLSIFLKSGHDFPFRFETEEECRSTYDEVVEVLEQKYNPENTSLSTSALNFAIKRFSQAVQESRSINPNQASLALLAIDDILHPEKK